MTRRFELVEQSESDVTSEEAGIKERLRGLLPKSRAAALRLIAGYGLMLFILGLGVSHLLGGITRKVGGIEDEEVIRQALGFVVCGYEAITKGGEYVEVPQSSGTCFAVRPNGFLITNKHVIDDHLKMRRRQKVDGGSVKGIKYSAALWVFFGPKNKYEAEVIYSSEKNDLAILKIDAKRLPVFRLAGEDVPARASQVYACGFPSAARISLSVEEAMESKRRSQLSGLVEKGFKERDFAYVSTAGSVSQVAGEETGRVWIQHDATIHGGNSGGPLIDDDGIVIGINTSKNRDAAGVSYALEMTQLREELDEWIEDILWK